MKPRHYRTSGLLRKSASVLALYLAVWLGVLAPGHRHELTQTNHQDCQLCRVSSQEYEAAPSISAPGFSVSLALLPAAMETPVSGVFSNFDFASRAPPSV